MRPDLEEEWVQTALILAVGAIMLFPIVVFHVGGTAAIEVVSVIVSGLLSLALVVLYFQQASILDKQRQLMHRDYQSALVQFGTAVADKDSVRVRLRNSGRGKVRRLLLKSEIVSETGDVDLDYGRASMLSVEDEAIEIPAESDTQEYEGDVRLRVLNHKKYEDDRHFPFRLISKILSARGIDSVTLRLTGEVEDEGILDERFSYTFEIAEQEISLQPPEKKEIDGEEVEVPQSTSVEDGIKKRFSSEQDINKERFEDLMTEGS